MFNFVYLFVGYKIAVVFFATLFPKRAPLIATEEELICSVVSF